MRIQFNLLPRKYIGVKRDWIGIIIFCILLLVSAGAFFAFHVSNTKLKKTVKVEIDKAKISKWSVKVNNLKKKIKKAKAILGRKAVKPEDIFKLKERIDFLNKFMGAEYIRWSYYLERMEKMAPEEMWIKNVVKKEVEGVPEFVYTCWAENLNQIYTFWSELEKDINFKDTILLSESEKIEAETKRKYVEFKMKFKYSPITLIQFGPLEKNLKKTTGTSSPYHIVGFDVSGKKVNVPAEWLKWKLIQKSTIANLELDPDGTTMVFVAHKTGKCTVEVTSPDGKLIAISLVEINQ